MIAPLCHVDTTLSQNHWRDFASSLSGSIYGLVVCTSQQILDTNHKKIYNKKLSVSQISVRNATCDIELASDSLTNKLDAVH